MKKNYLMISVSIILQTLPLQYIHQTKILFLKYYFGSDCEKQTRGSSTQINGVLVIIDNRLYLYE